MNNPLRLKLNRFRGFGLSLIIAGLILSIITYTTLGLIPLLALWIAFIIIGSSMLLTPEETMVKAEIIALMEDLLSNISAFFEALGVSSYATYIYYDDRICIFVSEGPLMNAPDSPPNSIIANINSKRTFVLRSPLFTVLKNLEGDFSSIAYNVIVELLEIADGIECSESEETISCLVKKPYVSCPGRLERTIGSIYGMCLASIASKVYRNPIVLVREEPSEDGRLIVLRRIINA